MSIALQREAIFIAFDLVDQSGPGRNLWFPGRIGKIR